MTGLNPFLLKKTKTFEKSFKKLAKSYKSQSQQQEFIRSIAEYLENLTNNPYSPKSRLEPHPKGIKIPENWQFYKLVIVIAKGASGQVRLMYLVNETEREIQLLLIYNYQQFKKRPADQDIAQAIQNALEF